MKRLLQFTLVLIAMVVMSLTVSAAKKYDVIIIGGGVSGTTAGIRSARLGAKTLIIEESPWLGGMLTSAGVSATDGNYRLRGGMWGEFRDRLEAHYGGAEALKTGWVSNLLFEPSVGAKIFASMAAAESNLTVSYSSEILEIKQLDNGLWEIIFNTPKGALKVYSKILIDATELGDIAAKMGVNYDIGMESRHITGEDIAPEEANGIIQDLTMVMIIKDYGQDMTIDRPASYAPTVFACACANDLCIKPKEENRVWSKQMMMSYGKLPNGKIMINWPIEGNDFYVNMINMNDEERAKAVSQAKEHTLNFLYFIQHELGYNTMFLADDEFPTEDLMPFIPYHRESRRIHGQVRFKLQHITNPYDYTLYRTAIGVGDYPVDQHHTRYTGWENLPNLYFHSIPSYGLPMGTLLPKDIDNLIVAEKSISVSNIVNGSTRLQPVVMQIGEAAGIIAAKAALNNIKLENVSVREVQQEVLNANGYLLPFLDIPSSHPHFQAMQRIGVCGIIKGEGMTVGWENQTWFYTDKSISRKDLATGLIEYNPKFKYAISHDSHNVTLQDLVTFCGDISAEEWAEWGLSDYNIKRDLTRLECAVVLDTRLQPFEKEDININGEFIR